MAGSLKGEVRLTFEGKPLTLVLDFNALCAFEGEVGENAQTRLDQLEKGNGSLSDMRALLWAMLQTHHSDMTLIDAGRVIGEGMAEVSAALASAFAVAMPVDGERRGKKPTATTKTKTSKPKARAPKVLRGR